MKISFLIFGLLALGALPFVIYLYFRKVKREKNKKNELKVTTKNFTNDLATFWGHLVYLFIAFVLLIASLVLIPIGIG